MIDTQDLREILTEIYGVDDRYLVYLDGDEYVPTIDPNERVGTYIGYRILAKEGYSRAYQKNETFVFPFKVHFRLSFVGPNAEKMADDTFFWDIRKDVKAIFEKRQAQMNYTSRDIYTRSMTSTKAGGTNGILAWVVDMSAQTDYQVSTHYEPWFPWEPNADGGVKIEDTSPGWLD